MIRARVIFRPIVASRNGKVLGHTERAPWIQLIDRDGNLGGLNLAKSPAQNLGAVLDEARTLVSERVARMTRASARVSVIATSPEEPHEHFRVPGIEVPK